MSYAEDMKRWMALGEKLRRLDPERFDRVLALARGYVAIYEDPEMEEPVFRAMMDLVRGGGSVN